MGPLSLYHEFSERLVTCWVLYLGILSSAVLHTSDFLSQTHFLWPPLELVPQSCLTLCHPTDCGPQDFHIHGILQARTLEWVAIPFSWGSYLPRDWTWVSCIAGGFFTIRATREATSFLHFLGTNLRHSLCSVWCSSIPTAASDEDPWSTSLNSARFSPLPPSSGLHPLHSSHLQNHSCSPSFH